MNKTSNLTIVIPTLNRHEYLRDTLESCLNQTFKDIKVIVVDNASEKPELNKKIVNQFNDERLNYVYFNERLDVGGSWSRAIKLIKTPYAKLMCDDDILHKQHVEVGMMLLSKYNEAIIFTCACDRFENNITKSFEDKIYNEVPYLYVPQESVSLLSYLDYVGGGMPSQTLFKTKYVVELQKPFDSEKYLDSPDSGCWINLFNKGGLVYCKTQLCAERKHDGQAQKKWTLDHYKKVYTSLKMTLWNRNLNHEIKQKLIKPEKLVKVLSLAVRLSGRFKRSFKPKDILLIADVYKFYKRKKRNNIKIMNMVLVYYGIQNKCHESKLKIRNHIKS